MEGGAAGDAAKDGRHAVVVIDQELAGGGAHEHLDAGTAGKPLELRQLIDILAPCRR